MLQAFILDLLTPLRRRIWSQLVVGKQAGIHIVDASRRRESPEDFLCHTIDALALIQRVDSRRFNRVLQHVCYIVHQELNFGAGRYDERLAACVVDFARLKFPQYPTGALHLYAALLVHEATHGAIHHRGIRYTDRTRVRIEHLCHIEEARFLRRINRHLGDGWMERAYRPDDYEREWRLGWWQRQRARWKRTREAKEMSNKCTAANHCSAGRSDGLWKFMRDKIVGTKWHREVLADRKARAQRGEAKFPTLDQLRERLRGSEL